MGWNLAALLTPAAPAPTGQLPGSTYSYSTGKQTAWGAKLLNTIEVDRLNALVLSGQYTQAQANAEYWHDQAVEEELAHARETSARQFTQAGLTSIATFAIGGLAFGATDAAPQIPSDTGGVVDLGSGAATDLGASAAPIGVSGVAEIAPAASTVIDAAATVPATGGGILGSAQQVVGAIGTVRGLVTLVNPAKPPARPAPVTQPPGAAAPRAPAPAAPPALTMTPAPAPSSRTAGVLAALAPLVILAFS